MPSVLLPDSELIARNYLAASTSVSALVSTRVSTELPDVPVFPCITLWRVGGIPDKVWGDHPRLQVEAWGRTKTEASQVARTAFAALLDIGQTHSQGVVTDCAPANGPIWAPDPSYTPAKPRFVFDVILTTHSL